MGLSGVHGDGSVFAAESPKEAVRALFLRRSLLGFAALIVLGIVLSPFLTANPRAAAIGFMATAVLMWLPCALLLRLGRVTQATWLFLSAGAILITLMVIFSNGLLGHPLQVGIAVIAVVLLNRKAAIIFAAGALLADLGLAIFQSLGGHFLPIFPARPLGTWFGVALVFVLVLPTIDLAMSHLSESEGRFRGAFRLNPEGIVIATRDGRVLEVNDAFLRITEHARSELMASGSALTDFFASEQERFSFRTRLAGRAPLSGYETEFRTKTGGSRYVQISAEQIGLMDEECVLVIVRDVTQQRTLEHRLRQAQKMEVLGRVTGGVVHRFNQFLAVISGSAEMLEMQVREGPAGQHVRRICETTTSAALLMRQLLAFTRRQALRPRILDLNVVVESLRTMSPQLSRREVETTLSLQEDLGKVNVDCAQIEQVILNLAANARDAMPGGGRLTITTADASLDQQFVLENGGKPAIGNYVMVAVADTGTGMTAEVRERIFEPFFTTKEPERAAGLGLAAAYGIVDQSGGFIVFDSEKGKGSTFKVYLPRVRAA